MKVYTYGQNVVSQFPKFSERSWEPIGYNVEKVDAGTSSICITKDFRGKI